MYSNGMRPCCCCCCRSGLLLRDWCLLCTGELRCVNVSPRVLIHASKVGISFMEDNCRALCTISSIGARTAVEPHNCVQVVRPRYFTRKYCGRINLNWEERSAASSDLVGLILIRIASGVNGAGADDEELSSWFECIKLRLVKSRWRLFVIFEFDDGGRERRWVARWFCDRGK